MNMKLALITFPIILLFSLAGCKKTEDINQYSELHGKYVAIEATSNKALDVNFDDTSSLDMLLEMPEIKHADLELSIRGLNVYSQFWPDQYFMSVNGSEPPLDYDPNVIVNYVKHASVGEFTIKNDTLFVSGVSEEFTVPNSVIIEGDQIVRVTFTKRLYTRLGWQEVEITVKYKQYRKD